jgi:hypothetical protein
MYLIHTMTHDIITNTTSSVAINNHIQQQLLIIHVFQEHFSVVTLITNCRINLSCHLIIQQSGLVSILGSMNSARKCHYRINVLVVIPLLFDPSIHLTKWTPGLSKMICTNTNITTSYIHLTINFIPVIGNKFGMPFPTIILWIHVFNEFIYSFFLLLVIFLIQSLRFGIVGNNN